MAAGIPTARGPGQKPGDIATHHETSEPGPPPLLRAALGILLGMATGVVMVVLTGRQRSPGGAVPDTTAELLDRGR